MKKCSQCNTLKSSEHFHKDTRARSGLQSQCKGCRRPVLTKYYEANSEAIRQQQSEYNQNKERRAEINKHSRLKHLQVRNEYSRKYRQENPEKRREQRRRRRARKLGCLGFVPAGYEQTLWKNQNGTCFYCGDDLEKTGTHEEHKTPLVRGGQHTKDNLCLACPDCNRRKHTKTAPEFLKVLSNDKSLF